jgi:hypothetical protein
MLPQIKNKGKKEKGRIKEHEPQCNSMLQYPIKKVSSETKMKKVIIGISCSFRTNGTKLNY